jgi:hypothetical protein
VNAATEQALVEHASALAALAGLYAAIDSLDAFARLAVDFPMPGEVLASDEDIALGVRKFHEDLDRAVRRVDVMRQQEGAVSGE